MKRILDRASLCLAAALCAVMPSRSFSLPSGATLGTPPQACNCCPRGTHSTRSTPALTSVTNGQVSGFSVETADRMAVLDLYHCVYQASEGFEDRMGWVGSVGSCNEGSVSDDFHTDTLRRINYFRAMAGVGTDVTFTAAKNAACQKAAMMMSRNAALTHSPPPSWSCWSLEGSNAAAHGNISYSSGDWYTGPPSIDGMIFDPGAGNVPVGHRRWLLYPSAAEMGNGGIPGDGSYGSGAAVWVVGDFVSPPSVPPWVAWPNAGFIPYSLIPERWSLSMPGADFDSATVAMTLDGAPLPSTIIHPTPASPAAGYGDPAIVWEPAGMPIASLATDAVYTVSVSGIADASMSSVSYTTTVINPGSVGLDTVVSGPTVPIATRPNRYMFDAIPGAAAYNVRIRTLDASPWLEGAEDSPTPMIIDGTSVDYDLRQTALQRTGSKGFQMAFPEFLDQWFEIDRSILPSDTSELTFYYRRRFSHAANTLSAEVSANEGLSWQPVWSTNGICSGGCSSHDWDPEWIPVAVDLSTCAGDAVRLRFYLTSGSSAYLGTSSSYGFFIDGVTVSNAEQLSGTTLVSLPASSEHYDFQPDAQETYVLDIGTEGECYTYGYGSSITVTSMPAIHLTGMAASNGSHVVDFSTTGGVCASYAVLSATNAGGPWYDHTGAVYGGAAQRFTMSPTGATPRVFYRITGRND